MKIFMDTDAVRGMAAIVGQTADNLDGRVDALLSQINSMEWQSNARTEFEDSFTGIHHNIKLIAKAMRLMGSAAEAKASQWEAIASKFLGPFVAVQNFWQAAIDHIGSVGAVIIGLLSGIVGLNGLSGNSEQSGLFEQLLKNLGLDRNIQGPSWKPNTPGWLKKTDTNTGGGFGGGGSYSSVGDSNGDGVSQLGGTRQAIPSSRTPADKLAVLGGCTNYVATKRDVSGFWKSGKMNAHYWNENAIAAGYEVGGKPVTGSIMVIEADKGVYNGIMDVDNNAGHVLYVENVKETSGGYLINYSHAATIYDDAGNYIPGTYKMLNNSTPIFVPYESSAVSFIYDKV